MGLDVLACNQNQVKTNKFDTAQTQRDQTQTRRKTLGDRFPRGDHERGDISRTGRCPGRDDGQGVGHVGQDRVRGQHDLVVVRDFWISQQCTPFCGLSKRSARSFTRRPYMARLNAREAKAEYSPSNRAQHTLATSVRLDCSIVLTSLPLPGHPMKNNYA